MNQSNYNLPMISVIFVFVGEIMYYLYSSIVHLPS